MAAKDEEPTPFRRPSEDFKKMNLKVKKTLAHQAFYYLAYVSVLIHFGMLVSQLIGVYFFWVSVLLGMQLEMFLIPTIPS